MSAVWLPSRSVESHACWVLVILFVVVLLTSAVTILLLLMKGGTVGSSLPAITATVLFWSVLVLAISFLMLPLYLLIAVATQAIVILAVACIALWWGSPSAAVEQSIMDTAAFTSTAGLEPPKNRLPGWYPARVPGQRGFRWWDPYANNGEGAFTTYRGHANDYTINRWNHARSNSVGTAVAMISVVVAVVMIAAVIGQLALMNPTPGS